MRNGTCLRVKEVYTLALVQDATSERQRSNLTTCNIKFQPRARIKCTRHPLATAPPGIINKERPLLLATTSILRQVSKPYDIQGLTESARAAT